MRQNHAANVLTSTPFPISSMLMLGLREAMPTPKYATDVNLMSFKIVSCEQFIHIFKSLNDT